MTVLYGCGATATGEKLPMSCPVHGSGCAVKMYGAVAERRQAERRKPTVDKEYAEGLAFVKAKGYTGPITVHVHEGIPKRIVLPNPEGW